MKKYLILPLLLALTACAKKEQEPDYIPGTKLIMEVYDKGTGRVMASEPVGPSMEIERGTKVYRCLDRNLYRDTTGNKKPFVHLPEYSCKTRLQGAEF